jgi:hypothetical protein
MVPGSVFRRVLGLYDRERSASAARVCRRFNPDIGRVPSTIELGATAFVRPYADGAGAGRWDWGEGAEEPKTPPKTPGGRSMAQEQQFEEHHHEAMVHDHEHWHVTHNHRAMTGGFEHLSWKHAHEHDHAELTHAHFPHEDFESEHLDEAHDHDHGEPVKERQAAKKASKKSASKKTGAKKKATKKTASSS